MFDIKWIRDNASAWGWRLSTDQLARIDQALARRGPIVTRSPV